MTGWHVLAIYLIGLLLMIIANWFLDRKLEKLAEEKRVLKEKLLSSQEKE